MLLIDTCEAYDPEVDNVSYSLSIRVRVVACSDDYYKNRLGRLLGPTLEDYRIFVVELDWWDEDEHDKAEEREQVKVPARNIEIVGVAERKRAILSVLAEGEYRLDVLRLYVKAGCTVNDKYHELDNGTALFYAALKGDKTAVRALAELGSELDAVNDQGWTPAMIAASQGKTGAMSE